MVAVAKQVARILALCNTIPAICQCRKRWNTVAREAAGKSLPGTASLNYEPICRGHPWLSKRPSFKFNNFILMANILSLKHCYFRFEDIDDCSSVTCANGGTCVDGVNQYSCACQEGFTGNLCESGKVSYRKIPKISPPKF